MSVALMLATGIPTAYWDDADDVEIVTTLQLLAEQHERAKG